MYKHPITNLLRSLDSKQISRFELFLKSPYHNRSNKAIQLFNELLKFYPSFDDEKLSKRNLGKELYSEKDYKDSTIRDLLSLLLKLCLKFLGYEFYNQDMTNEYLSILEQLYAHKQDKLFDRYADLFGNEKSKNTKIDYNWFKFKSSLERTRYNVYSTSKNINRKVLASDHVNILNEAGLNFIIFFIGLLTTDLINIVVCSRDSNLKYDTNYLIKFYGNLKLENLYRQVKIKHDKSFMIEMYNYALKSILYIKNDKYYDKYKHLIITHYDKLSTYELSLHRAILNNCITYKTSYNKEKYLPELFKAKKFFFEKGFYVQGGILHYINPNSYIDMLYIALNCREFEWAENFLKKYSPQLPLKTRNNLPHLGFAYLYLYTGKTEKALDELNLYKPDEYNRKYDERYLRIMIFYELKYFDAVSGLLKNLYKLVKEDDNATKTKKLRIKNFVKIVKNITLYNLRKPGITINEIKKEFQSMKIIVKDSWIKDKIQKLSEIK